MSQVASSQFAFKFPAGAGAFIGAGSANGGYNCELRKLKNWGLAWPDGTDFVEGGR